MNTLKKEFPKRFTDAVSKLYDAFHSNQLDVDDCEACVVGNIIGHGEWLCGDNRYITGMEIQPFDLFGPNDSGYSVIELSQIEYRYIVSLGEAGYYENDKETQFQGLCAVVQYLCELDEIPNIMDYTSLFETKEDKPVNELSF
jgi:hypothetical protein